MTRGWCTRSAAHGIAGGAASVLLLAVPVLAALTGCTTPVGPGTDEIVAVDFSQSQAIPDFDDAEYTQDDPAAIVEFQSLLMEHGVDLATWQSTDDGCPGSRTTQVTVRYAAAGDATQFSVDSCSDDPFELEADELFSHWHDELAG